MHKEISKSRLLIMDGIINLVLGVILLLSIPFGKGITQFLGVPDVGNGFYASILGAIFVGIAIALFQEVGRENIAAAAGLGLTGAIAINLSGGIVLAILLIFGDFALPLRGQIFLWTLTLVLILVSSLEWLRKNK